MMNQGTSEYWRKLLRINDPVPENYLKEFKSPLEIFRPIFYLIIDPICRFYLKVRVFGLENIPKELPYIIAPNHVSALDQTMVSYALGSRRRNQMYTLAVKHFYDRFFPRIFMKIAANVMRIDPEKDFFPAIRAAVNVLKLGKMIYINPEGTRSETGELLPFRVGVGMLAVETGAPIVPVHIHGTYRSMPPGKAFPKPSKITVSFGEPIYMDGYIKRKQDEMAYDVYKSVTDELLKRIISLKVRKENL
jgi:1-acyl-sn-glycerol-3-phosphate acyltransferase